MSYSPYTAPTGSVPPPTSTTYPYGAYHQTPYAGTYPYQNPYTTGVTSYAAWPYPYAHYMQQHPQTAQMQRVQTHTPAPIATAPTVTNIQSAPMTTTQAAAPPPTPVVATPAAPQRSSTATFSPYVPTYTPREPIPQTTSSHNVGSGRGGKRQSNLKGLFTKDLRSLMYGFGDDRNPSNDAVNVMEEILIEYITDVCTVAGANSKRSRLSIEDLRKALSRPADAKKLARLEELLFMQEDIKRARGMFEESDIQNPKQF